MSAPESAAAARRADDTAKVGMAIFLGAAAMLFAALFFAYAVMRAQAPAWPPAGQAPLPRGALAVNTLLLAAASLVLRRALAAARAGDVGRARRRTFALTAAALALAGAFLVAQAAVWRALVGAGAGPASGIYGSVFFALSGLHALHVAGGIVALALAAARGPTARRLGVCALYWDFVLGVWVLFYVTACLR